MKEYIGVLAAILAIVGLLPYAIDVLKKRTQPHLFTWIIWTIATIIAFLGQWVSGGGPGSWTTGVTAIIVIFITFLSIKNGTTNITTSDKVSLAGALLAIIPWLLTKDPTLSVVIITFIDICGFIPTIRKSYEDPGSETLFTYSLNIFRHSLSIVALNSYSLSTYLFPGALVIMNIILTSVILISRLRIRDRVI